jgi:hypothetical protein
VQSLYDFVCGWRSRRFDFILRNQLRIATASYGSRGGARKTKQRDGCENCVRASHGIIGA